MPARLTHSNARAPFQSACRTQIPQPAARAREAPLSAQVPGIDGKRHRVRARTPEPDATGAAYLTGL